MTTTLLGSLILVTAYTAYAVRQRNTWSETRDIRVSVPWPVVFATQAAGVLIAAPYTHHVWGTGPAIAMGAFVWLAVLAVFTDLGSRKIPYEVPLYLIAPVGVVAFALNYTIEGLLAFGAATVGLVGVPLVARALTNKGLGASDVRFLWAATATCSWWVGQTWLLYALIGACLIQMLVRLVAAPLNLGSMVPTHPERPVPDGQAPTMRRELPFAPALVAGFLIAITYGTYTAYGACQMWNVLGVCR